MITNKTMMTKHMTKQNTKHRLSTTTKCSDYHMQYVHAGLDACALKDLHNTSPPAKGCLKQHLDSASSPVKATQNILDCEVHTGLPVAVKGSITFLQVA